MNTFELRVEGDREYIKTEATAEQFERVLDFVKTAENYNTSMILPALRALGYKSQAITIEATQSFEF